MKRKRRYVITPLGNVWRVKRVRPDKKVIATDKYGSPIVVHPDMLRPHGKFRLTTRLTKTQAAQIRRIRA